MKNPNAQNQGQNQNQNWKSAPESALFISFIHSGWAVGLVLAVIAIVVLANVSKSFWYFEVVGRTTRWVSRSRPEIGGCCAARHCL